MIVSSLLLILALMISLPATNPLMIFITCLPYLVIGIVSFALSKFLAKLVCFDLDKFDEQK